MSSSSSSSSGGGGSDGRLDRRSTQVLPSCRRTKAVVWTFSLMLVCGMLVGKNLHFPDVQLSIQIRYSNDKYNYDDDDKNGKQTTKREGGGGNHRPNEVEARVEGLEKNSALSSEREATIIADAAMMAMTNRTAKRRHRREEARTFMMSLATKKAAGGSGRGSASVAEFRSAAYCDYDFLQDGWDSDTTTTDSKTEMCYFENLFYCQGTFYLPTAGTDGDDKKDHDRDRDDSDIRVCTQSRCWVFEVVRRVTPEELGRVCRLHYKLADVCDVVGTTLFYEPHDYNVGHNMLDGAFPAWFLMRHFFGISHRRKVDRLASRTGGHVAQNISQRRWSERFFGVEGGDADTVIDANWLDSNCGTAAGRGACRFTRILMGAGGLGLSTVDRSNHFGGAYVDHALYQFREAVIERFTPSDDHNAAAKFLPEEWRRRKPGQPKVVWCANKRGVDNLYEVLEAIGDGNGVFVLDWGRYTFEQHGDVLQNADIVWTGVGTSQMSLFLMRPGSVVVQIGRPTAKTKSRADYFDAALLNSLEHVRALWMPRYGSSSTSSVIDLDVVRDLMREAKSLLDNYAIPVPRGTNCNWVDGAYSRMVELEPQVHRDRIAKKGCVTNSPMDLFAAKAWCAWGTPELQRKIREEFPDIV